MSLQDVMNKISFGQGTIASDVSAINTVIQTIYNGSAAARAMLDELASSDRTLTFANGYPVNEPNRGGIGPDGNGYVLYNFPEIAQNSSISDVGKVFGWSNLTIITHEIIHAVKGFVDHEQPNYTTPGADYMGEVVPLERTILSELGITDLRNSYEAVIANSDLASIGGQNGVSLTNGQAVDLVISDIDNAAQNSIDTSDRTGPVLLIGLHGADDITAGAGSDFIYGGVGDDFVRGSLGNDYNNGNADSDIMSYGELATSVEASIKTGSSGAYVEVAKAGNGGVDADHNFETYFLTQNSDVLKINDLSVLQSLGTVTFNALSNPGGTDIDTLDFNDAIDPIQILIDGPAKFFNFEKISGSQYDDQIELSDPAHNELSGNAGNDILSAGAGADTLDGGAGNDTLKGGAGADKLIYTEGTDQLEGGAGNDFYDFSGAVGTDKLASIVFRPGDGNDYINNRTTLNQIVLEGVNSSDVSCVYDYQVTSQYNNGNIRVYEISGTFLLLLDGTSDSICIEGVRGYYEQPSWASEPDWGGFGAGISLVFDDKTVAGSSWQTVFGRPYLDIDSTPIPSQYTTAPADHDAEKNTAPDMNGIPGGLDGTTIFDDGGGPSASGPGTPGPDLFLTGSIGGAGNGTFDGGAGVDTISYAQANNAVVVNLAAESATGADIGQDVVRNIENVTGGNGNDQLTGNARNNVLDGGAAGSDSIDGGDGSDTAVFSLNRSQYIVTLLTSGGILVSDGTAADTIANVEHFSFADGVIAIGDLTFDGDDETGVIVGTPGDDLLTGTAGDDIIRGGLGNDTLEGGAGSDTYRYNVGDGADAIDDWADASSTDVLELGAGISPGSVTVDRGTDDFWDVVLGFGNGDSVTIKGGFFAGSSVVEEVQFADNTVWDVGDLRQIHLDAAGTPGSDTINGFIDVNDLIRGGGGNDTIFAYSGNDTIYGDAGDDEIFGNEGDDTIIGGAGNDFMIGEAGSDVFVLNTGDGEDWINDFEVGVDKIDLSAITSISGFSELTANAAEWVAGSTWLYTDPNNYVRLEGVSLASLQASDFIFA